VQAWHMSARDTVLIPAALHNAAPFVCCFTALLCGACVIVMPRFDEERTLAIIEQHGVTWMLLVPTMMIRLWRLPDATRCRYRVSSVQTLWHVGAPCPAWLKEAWISWLGPEVIWEIYSATDACACTVMGGTVWLSHRGSFGRVADGEIRIVDEHGAPAVAGALGEVCTRRGAGAAPSYRYLGPQKRKVYDDGWESTGDIGWMDEAGYLYLADRRTDMILVGGVNVFPAEIEAALEEHPCVRSSAVIGLPDDDLGNRIHAIVCAHRSVHDEELLAHLASRLARYKHPQSFEYVAEPLRDEAGKIRRYRLREERMAKTKGRGSWLADAFARAQSAGSSAADLETS
jgi:bile acid-coenzyme A ligase